MKNFILSIFILFLFSGCSTSSLEIDKNNDLMLKYSSSDIRLTNKILDTKLLNFKDLFVTIYKLQGENNKILFYEDARTALNFEFNFGGLYSVMYIFDNSQKFYELYQRNNLRLVQIKLKDSGYLNVMIQSSSVGIYSYVYGFSNKEFIDIANRVKLKESDVLGVLEHEGITFTHNSKAMSNWNDLMVYFTPLIIPVRELGRL